MQLVYAQHVNSNTLGMTQAPVSFILERLGLAKSSDCLVLINLFLPRPQGVERGHT